MSTDLTDIAPRKSKGTLRRLARHSAATEATDSARRPRSDSTRQQGALPSLIIASEHHASPASSVKHRPGRSGSKHFSASSLAEVSGRSIRALYQSARRVSKDGSDAAGSSRTKVDRHVQSVQPQARAANASNQDEAEDIDENVTIKPLKQTPGSRHQNTVNFPSTERPTATNSRQHSRHPSRTHKGSLSLFIDKVKDKATSSKSQAADPAARTRVLPPGTVIADGSEEAFESRSPAAGQQPSLQRFHLRDEAVPAGGRQSLRAGTYTRRVQAGPTAAAASPVESDTAFTQSDEDHYTLRLAVTFLVRTILPSVRLRIRQSEPPLECYKAIVEQLQPLARMERAWGVQWMLRRSSADLRLSERTKEKERAVLTRGLQDGLIMRQ